MKNTKKRATQPAVGLQLHRGVFNLDALTN